VADVQAGSSGVPPADRGDGGHPDASVDRDGRDGRRWVAIGIVIALVVGASAYAGVRFLAPAEDRAIELVPRDSFAYVNLFLEPSTAQRRAIRDLLERLPPRSPDRAGELIADLLDRPLREFGLRFDEDVEPWLGHQIAGFVLPPAELEGDIDGGVLIATEDEDATRGALRKYREANDVDVEPASYKDHGLDVEADGVVTGFLGSFLFVGTRPGFEAAADAEESGRSLAESDAYLDATRGLKDDHLAIGYVDTSGLMEAIRREASSEVAGFEDMGLLGGQTQAAVVYVTREGVLIDQASYLPGGPLGRALEGVYGERGIMERLPRDAWVALDLPNFGRFARVLFDEATGVLPGGLGGAAVMERIQRETGLDLQADVFDWMDDAALYVSGTNRVDIGGGVLFSSSRPAASDSAVHRIAGVLIGRGAPVRQITWRWQGNVDIGRDPGRTKGYALDIGQEEPLHLVADDDRVVLAYGDEATGQALDASSYLGDGLEWKLALETLDAPYVPFFYVDLQAARSAIESFGVASDPVYMEDVQPWLEPLSHVISGARRTGGKVLTRTVIGVT